MDLCRPWGATGPLWPPVAQATGDRDLFVIFFSSNRSLAADVVQGGPVAPPNGRQGGACRPPTGRQGRAALFNPPSHPSFYSLKFQKK